MLWGVTLPAAILLFAVRYRAPARLPALLYRAAVHLSVGLLQRQFATSACRRACNHHYRCQFHGWTHLPQFRVTLVDSTERRVVTHTPEPTPTFAAPPATTRPTLPLRTHHTTAPRACHPPHTPPHGRHCDGVAVDYSQLDTHTHSVPHHTAVYSHTLWTFTLHGPIPPHTWQFGVVATLV